MAQEPVEALDFLGLGTSMREIETELGPEDERGDFAEPTSSLLAVSERSSARADDQLDIHRPRLVLGIERSHSSAPPPFALPQAMPWASMPGKAEQMERSGMAVSSAEEKRVDELSDEDIMQLSGDQCKRYMMMMKKEREVVRPTPTTGALSVLPTAKPWFRMEGRNEDKLGQGGALARSTGQGHLPGRPPTAQLTIFYSGMVNVYDAVPADKAQAIMLLAGSGSSWSSSTVNPLPSVPGLPSTGRMASFSNSPARPGPASAVAGVSQAGPAASPLVPTIAVTAGAKQGVGRAAVHAELPQARKASLARFLENRKDRVRGKAPYVPVMFSNKKDVGSSTPPRERSPSPINGNSFIRSASPAIAVPRVHVLSQKRSFSSVQRPGTSQLRGSEIALQTSHLVAFQQGALLLPTSSEDQDSTSATHRPIQEDLMDWRGQQRLHPSPQEKELEALEEDTGSPSQHQ